jgi:hypothetical protein
VGESFLDFGDKTNAAVLERVRYHASSDGFEDGAVGSRKHPTSNCMLVARG